jgi:hypothetical protein
VGSAEDRVSHHEERDGVDSENWRKARKAEADVQQAQEVAEREAARQALVRQVQEAIDAAFERLEAADYPATDVPLRFELANIVFGRNHSWVINDTFTIQRIVIRDIQTREFQKDIVTETSYVMWPFAVFSNDPREPYNVTIVYLCPTLQTLVVMPFKASETTGYKPRTAVSGEFAWPVLFSSKTEFAVKKNILSIDDLEVTSRGGIHLSGLLEGLTAFL